jgi:hypothetical protein
MTTAEIDPRIDQQNRLRPRRMKLELQVGQMSEGVSP